MALIPGLKTSRDIWVALETHYASQSLAEQMRLRRSLQHIRKGNLSMQEYLLKVKRLSDSLAAAGTVVPETDLQQNILTVLDSAYDAIVTTLTATMNSLSMSDFQDHLLAFETRLDVQTKTAIEQPSANVAKRNSPLNTPYRSSTNDGPCQICGRQNHVAYNCFDHFERSFNPPTVQPHSSQQPGQAYIAQHAPHHRDVNWYMDSGATNHITNDFSALGRPSEYEGTDQIRVGNGSSLPISHFARDNNVYFEFHPTYFLVKDRQLGRVVLQGKNKDGLYMFDDATFTTSSSALIVPPTTTTPSSPILQSSVPPSLTTQPPLTNDNQHTMITRGNMAMDDEINALMRNNTWILTPFKPSMNVIGCKWVFQVKIKSDGSLDRYKARLVAKGFNQKKGIDYYDTFNPVVKPCTIRMILSLPVSRKWPIHQLDVQNSFLHGNLNEEVYMRQPHGYIDQRFPDYVCKLIKSIYGLKQASRTWYRRLSSYLLEIGFISSKADSSLFILNGHSGTAYVLVYVDDITASTTKMVNYIIQKLQDEFAIKDLGPLSYFLGIEVVRDDTGMFLSQRKYIVDLLRKVQLDGVKSISTPMSTSMSLTVPHSLFHEDVSKYRSVVGALQYLTLTRPDISFAVNRVCQFMHSPKVEHWVAVKHILRYLKHTINYGIFFRPTLFSLCAYSDSDLGGYSIDRRSTSGSCVFFGGNIISWSSRKQRTVSRSSTEAEFKGLANTTAELIWIESLLNELNIKLPQPPSPWCDNLGATYLSSNPVFHSLAKHIKLGSAISICSDVAFTELKEANNRTKAEKILSDSLRGELEEAREGFRVVESGLNEKLKDSETRAEGLAKEVERLKAELAAKENLNKEAIIAEFKASDVYDFEVAQAGVPEVRRSWVVAERHIKTDPLASWESFIQEFLAAKDVVEQGQGEPEPYDGPSPSFL
ncbi:hypothetical protein AgCh_014300 [Apium graveolens]